MDLPRRVIEAMRPGQSYSPNDLAGMIHADLDVVASSLERMDKLGLIEMTGWHRYKRRRDYKTRQRDLFRS